MIKPKDPSTLHSRGRTSIPRVCNLKTLVFRVRILRQHGELPSTAGRSVHCWIRGMRARYLGQKTSEETCAAHHLTSNWILFMSSESTRVSAQSEFRAGMYAPTLMLLAWSFLWHPESLVVDLPLTTNDMGTLSKSPKRGGHIPLRCNVIGVCPNHDIFDLVDVKETFMVVQTMFQTTRTASKNNVHLSSVEDFGSDLSPWFRQRTSSVRAKFSW